MHVDEEVVISPDPDESSIFRFVVEVTEFTLMLSAKSVLAPASLIVAVSEEIGSRLSSASLSQTLKHDHISDIMFIK